MKTKQPNPLKSSRKGHSSAAASPAPGRAGDARQFSDELGLERIALFSDAVFAIAITLLALEIRLPPLPEGASNSAMLAALNSLWPRYISYIFSFLVIGRIWLGHHRTFRYVCRYNQTLLLLNVLLLMVIGFLPFPTSVIGENGNTVATIFYAGSMAAASTLFALLWWYASAGGRLIGQEMSPPQFRRMWLSAWSMPLLFLLSMPLALWSPAAAQLSWVLMIVPLFINEAEETRWHKVAPE